MNRIQLFGAALISVWGLAVAPAYAGADDVKYIDSALMAQIRGMLSHPVVQLSINAQNQKYKTLTAKDIHALDDQWVKERNAEVQPLIAATMNSPLSNYLTQIQAKSLGLFSEIFVIDAKGLNVGQSSVTTDFWQGDEAKFQKTYNVSSDAVFVDKPEFDKATATWRAQINLTLADNSGKSIGAAAVEVNLTELGRRHKAGVK